MSYDIHITRGTDWSEEERPVTLDEVRSIMYRLSDKFRIEESGVISIENPNGQNLTMKAGPYLEYTGENGEKTCVLFTEGRSPSFRYQSDGQLHAMCAVCEAVGAKLMGDEGEEYDRQQIENRLMAQIYKREGEDGILDN